MTCRANLTHRSVYHYDRHVQLGPQLIRLRPVPHVRAQVISYSLSVMPNHHFLHWQQDAYSNYQARVLLPEKINRLEVIVELAVDLVPFNPFDFFVEPQAEQMPILYSARDQLGLGPYRQMDAAASDHTGRLHDLYTSIRSTQVPTIAFLVDVNRRIHSDIAYVIRPESGIQTPEETLAKGSGSCRDLAWLSIQLLRRFGFAARFVSGYWIQAQADAHVPELHAWVEVYVPGAGWLGLDPTAGLAAGPGHIPLACSPEPSGAAPIEGSVESCGVHFDHDIRAILSNDASFSANRSASL